MIRRQTFRMPGRSGVLSLLRLASVCLGLAVLLGAHLPADAQDTAQAAAWTMIVPGGETLCARETPFVFWARERDPAKLLVYFQGGGMCWNAETCAPGAGAFDEVIEGDEIGAYSRGIFDDANLDNPLADASAVFIPYCTGDWHTGARTVDYGGEAGIVHHNGQANASAALAWTMAQFPRPTQVVIAGCSAGAYGAVYHAPALTRRYRGAAVFGDSGVGVMPGSWGGLDVWGTYDHAPVVAPADQFIGRLWANAARNAGRARFAQYATTGDEVQQRYLNLMGGGDWAGGRAAALTTLSGLRNFRAFTADSSDHCILETDRFYSEIASSDVPEGARFRDAFAAWAAG